MALPIGLVGESIQGVSKRTCRHPPVQGGGFDFSAKVYLGGYYHEMQSTLSLTLHSMPEINNKPVMFNHLCQRSTIHIDKEIVDFI